MIEAKADAASAWVTSRLEFYREPAWMKQWPFAHTIELTLALTIRPGYVSSANSASSPGATFQSSFW